MMAVTDQPLTASALLCVTRIQFCMLNNRCQTEERKEAFAFLLLWTLLFQSSHFFSCHDSVNRSLSFSHACCILMRDQFMNVICRVKQGPARPWRCIQVLAGQPSGCRFAPRGVSAPHLCCVPAVGYAAEDLTTAVTKKFVLLFPICHEEKELWSIHGDRGMTSKVCHKESQDFCQVGIAGSWKLVSAGELWGLRLCLSAACCVLWDRFCRCQPLSSALSGENRWRNWEIRSWRGNWWRCSWAVLSSFSLKAKENWIPWCQTVRQHTLEDVCPGCKWKGFFCSSIHQLRWERAFELMIIYIDVMIYYRQ